MPLPPNIHTSPHRPPRHSCQEHSYHTPDSPTDPQSLFKYAATTPPQGPKFLASSHGHSSKISRYLIPLISKFEALDAVSHGFKILSLQPAHLQLSPKQSGATKPLCKIDGAAHKSCQSVSSPRSKGQSQYEDILPEKTLSLISPDDVFTSTTNNLQQSPKRSGSRRLKQTQSPRKVSSIRLCGGIQQYDFGALKQSNFGSKIRGRYKHPKEIADYSAQKIVVMERNKNFDGSIDPHTPSHRLTLTNAVVSNSAHGSPVAARLVAANTTLRPAPKYDATPITPSPCKPTDLRGDVDLYSVSSKMDEWKPKSISIKHGTPHAPSSSDSVFRAKRKNHTFGQDMPDPFAQTPASKSPITSVSPKTKNSPRLTVSKRDDHLLLGRTLYDAGKDVPGTVKTDPSLGEPRGRTLVSSPVRGNLVNLERRSTNQKLGALYRAKSLDRAGYKSPEVSRALEVVSPANTRLKRNIFQPTSAGKMEDTREWWGKSRVEGMKMFYERGVVNKKSASRPFTLSKASGTRILRLSKLEECSNPFPSPPPLLIFSSSATNAAAGSLVLRPKPPKVEGSRMPTLVMQDQPALASPKANKTDAKSRGIRDKMKLFGNKEKGKEVQRDDSVDTGSKERGKEGKKVNTLSKKSRNATIKERANIFENPWNDDGAEKEKERGLVGQDVQDIMDEFQDTAVNTEPNVEKSRKTTGGWHVAISPRLRSLAEQKDGEVDDRMADMEQEMVIKQAQCRLREPKPLRASELKRMALLCKSKGKIRMAGAGHRTRVP